MKTRKFNKKHRFLHSLITKKDPVILEIGAHVGIDSKLFLDWWPSAVLYCFEPDPRNLDMLDKLNKLVDGKLNIVPVAICDKEGEKKPFYQFYLEPTDKGIEKYTNLEWITRDDFLNRNLSRSASSSLKTGHPATDSTDVVKVETRKLDNWAAENGVSTVDLIWIDVQGAEREVLDGAKEILNNTNFIFIEYGEMEYQGGMTRNQTIEVLQENFRVLSGFSSSAHKGDLLFVNKNLKINKKSALKNKILGFLKEQYSMIKGYKVSY